MTRNGTSSSGAGGSGRLLAWLQLFRLPNVFTAFADVMMGFLVTRGGFSPPLHLLILVAASACLYTAGMVLNDVFDFDQDTRERPSRPLPSGRISVGLARLVGIELLLVGAALGWLVGSLVGNLRPGIVASVLAVCVFGYDRILKRTSLGPLGMGACRLLNVLLGMSVATGPWHEYHWDIAAGIGIYIAGVTWLARSEARESSRAQLILATAVMLAGIAVLALHPLTDPLAKAPLAIQWPLPLPRRNWYLLWGVVTVLIGWRCLRAIAEPRPDMVQPAVKTSILSLVTLDAVVAFGYQPHAGIGSVPYAVIIFLLVLPAMFLGRWIYST